MIAFLTLFNKEIKRFLNVAIQTVGSPILSALLYQMIFSHALKNTLSPYPEISYTAFLIPGLIMMGMAQNAFANTSSSLIQSKVMGNLVFLLLSPVTPFVFFASYVSAAIVRGLMVGLGVFAVTVWFGLPLPKEPLWLIMFAILACALMGTFGLIAGIYSNKFDHLATFQNFVIMPLTFLSGVFYSIHSLPDFWQKISLFNPIFYMVDGFRFGFFGYSDQSPWLSLLILLFLFITLSAFCIYKLHDGKELRNALK